MDDVIAVKIIYDDENRISFNFFAELFRLVGLYVEEVLLEKDTDMDMEKKGNPYQLFLCISSEPVEGADVILAAPACFGRGVMDCSDTQRLEYAQQVLDKIQMWAQEHHSYFPCDVVKQVLPIYVKNTVLKGAMQLQYYRMKMEDHRETEQIFQRTVADLEKLEFDSKYLTYALLYCKQKVNLSCYFQDNKPLDYAISALLDDCDKLIENYPEFSNAKVLKGMICERSEERLKMAIDAYLDALDQIRDKTYASHVYYWVGLLYQKFNNSQDEALYAYERSCQLKKKYRNVYKLGYMAEQEGDYKKTVAYYKECVELLEKKFEEHMDPLEIEYYFKTGVLIAYHCQRNLEDYQQSIVYGKKMMDFYEKEFSENPNQHFRYFYGSEAQKYQEISQKRLRCQKLYECLAIAYREIGDKEKSMEYWKLSKQN